MTGIKDPTTQLRPWPHISSDRGQANLDLGISATPPQAEEALPERYGIPQLEVLVVDPENIFLCWEITTEQLNAAKHQLGDQLFDSRRLVVALEGENGNVLDEYELYGELGRWFIRHTHFGERVRARLMFLAGNQNFDLYTTGLLELPRVFPIEPEFYQELEVIYGIGSKGQLILKGFMEDKTAPWPKVALELPSELAVYLDNAGLGRTAYPLGGASSPTSAWLPSSPSTWPTSPHGKHLFAASESVSHTTRLTGQRIPSKAKGDADD